MRFSLGQHEANDGNEEVLSKGVPPPDIGGVGFGSSPNLAMDHTLKLTTPIDLTGRSIHQE